MSLLYPECLLNEDSRGRVKISKWVQAALHPAYEFVFYLSALFTAAWASGNAAEIMQVVNGTTPFSAIGDVLLFVGLTTMLHGINRWAVLIQREAAAQSTENVREQLLEETSRLRWLVRTMPEEGFLNALGSRYALATSVARTVLETGESVPPEQIAKVIRFVLFAYAETAQRFDGTQGEMYHANIMVYHPRDEIREIDAGNRLREHLIFERDEIGIDRLGGVLALRTDLAVKTKEESSDNFAMDDTLSRLTLAIREEAEGANGKSFLLPGAPRAWYRRKADAYLNTDKLVEWYSENCVRDEYVESQIRKYFGEGNSGIGSLVSYPLSYNEGPEDNLSLEAHYHTVLRNAKGLERPIGVLNIHRASPGILREDAEVGRYFQHVVRPLRILCTRLLYKLRDAEEAEYETWNNLVDVEAPIEEGDADK